ncbi:MAG: glucoamylase family protein, partial [Clostridia bacterium]
MNRLRIGNEQGALPLDAALSDAAMLEYARSLAAQWSINGRARRAPGRGTAARLMKLGREAERLAAQSAVLPPAMRWLTDNIRWVEVEARDCAHEKGKRIPARDGMPRISRLMGGVVSHSDGLVTQARLTEVLQAFDRVQGLSMAEIWLAPRALRIALIASFDQMAQEVLSDQRARLSAEKWVNAGAPVHELTGRESCAFCERALKLLHEQESPEARMALEKWLDKRDGDSGISVHRAHERQAIGQLVLANLTGSLRALGGFFWADCFQKISRAEQILQKDAVYCAMDDRSRNLVRGEVGLIARRSGLSEWTVARHAVRAAQASNADRSGQNDPIEREARENREAPEAPDGRADWEEREGRKAPEGRADWEGREGREDPDAREDSESCAARGTCCWWLYDDAGRRALMARLGAARVRLRKITPDPSGRGYLVGFLLLTALIGGAIMRFSGHWYWMIPMLLIAWQAAGQLLDTGLSYLLRPRALLKLEIDQVPEAMRTLVTVPALITSPERARELVTQLETLGALCPKGNIEYLLLGDFCDGTQAEAPDDQAIVDTAREGVAALNRACGWDKYHYLHRNRVYVPVDKRFMGNERKRGALMALNQLLLGGESTFDAADDVALAGRFCYVLTLDADTRLLPSAQKALIGLIAHPVNRLRVEDGRRKGYALIQPRVEVSAHNRFSRLLGGLGGVDSYPTHVSSAYQDACGRAIYGGKGIYDVRAFSQALAGRLPDGSILSHDLIEGALAGAGLASDVTVHDGFPSSVQGYFKRMHRWTRGDWQLAPFIFGALPLKMLDRFLMLDNLARSLNAAAIVLVLMVSLWTGQSHALLIALLAAFWSLLLQFPSWDMEKLRQTLAQVALLPETAYTQLDAAIRALYRTFVSRRGMLEWTPAADAERAGKKEMGGALPGRVMALALIPVLFRPGWAPVALGVGLLFMIGMEWMRALETPEEKVALEAGQVEALRDLAARTWRFFEIYVPEDSLGLPPDNVQIDPPVGVARRTSPTNIGLYLMSCLSAKLLGFLSQEKMRLRMARTVETLEALEKWKGQMYNWYDLETRLPLAPKYVSAVDSGNLAASLLLCAGAVKGELGTRMERLAREMDFRALYDGARKLFYIGIDVEHDRLSESHYDLLASESRILSYTAIALGQAPIAHWFSLGRARNGPALISWSGTLFEYLMPELFMRAPEYALFPMSNRYVVALQRAAHPDGWGVSESGFFAFDLQMNYQYRAFGLNELSLRGGSFENVIAPYASMLALAIDAPAAAENLAQMVKRGWMGELGLYEAVDLDPARLPEGVKSRVVMSHMAHHQGMILSAIANCLTGDQLVRSFSARPEMRALELLLEEKNLRAPKRARRNLRAQEPFSARPLARATREGRAGQFPDGHLLFGAGSTCFVEAGGGGFLKAHGVMANRFREALVPGEADGLFVHVRIDDKYVNLLARVRFGEGEAQWRAKAGDVSVKLTQSVSPEDGRLTQRVEIQNAGARAVRARVVGCFAVALCAQAAQMAHPAFQQLFVFGQSPAPGTLLFTRKGREAGEQMRLVYVLDAPAGAIIGQESDLARLLGRDGALDRPESLAEDFAHTDGATLNPCAALRGEFALGPGEKKCAVLTCALCKGDQAVREVLGCAGREAAERAQMLAGTQARAMLDFLSIDAQTHHLLQRASAFLVYPQLKWERWTQAKLSRDALWALGLSGDLPIIAVFIGCKEQMPVAREAARAHEFYRAMGVHCDLVLVNDYGNDYLQPVREQMRNLIEHSHLRGIEKNDGGATLLEGQALGGEQVALLRKVAALCFDGGKGQLTAQIKRMLPVEADEKASVGQMRPDAKPGALKRLKFNGWGGFTQDGAAYAIDLMPGKPTPAAWCNILANPDFGCLVSERGGGFAWAFNSRLTRLTAWSGDPLREGFSHTLALRDTDMNRAASLIPVTPPARAIHTQGMTQYLSGAEGLRWTLTLFVDCVLPVKCTHVEVINRSGRTRHLTLTTSCAFLMGAGSEEARMTCVRAGDGLIVARGAMAGAGYLALAGARYARGALALGFEIAPGAAFSADVLLGWAESADQCAQAAARFCEGIDPEAHGAQGANRSEGAGESQLAGEGAGACGAKNMGGGEARLKRTRDWWEARLGRIAIHTPDVLINAMVNRWLPYQALAGRVMARAGLYQAGGAFGFRDQLQDMLCLIPIAPEMVRAHLLTCAAHQFEEGDVMHWWHAPAVGVRTHISDDMLFLPYVTHAYVKETGDRSVLSEAAPYLLALTIPDGQEDVYAQAQEGNVSESLHLHCLRAIGRAARTGRHGLALMGSGDWNDGMNRVGEGSEGESVWLSMFLAEVAAQYADLCEDALAEKLRALSQKMRAAVEAAGWDGKWYRRAYYADASAMGSDDARAVHGCRIDLIAQAWAALGGFPRAEEAMGQAWDQLADEKAGLIKLLTPAFDGIDQMPGYIAAYPKGVRENGGQYTHGACWGVMGWAALGQGERAWQALHMLMPFTHAATREGAQKYRVEPYVVAADVYGEPPFVGRGGWTWYTGAASWLVRATTSGLMGYERVGTRARLRAQLPEAWSEAQLCVAVGKSRYTLIARRDATGATLDGRALDGEWVNLIDDASAHEAVFPLRTARHCGAVLRSRG